MIFSHMEGESVLFRMVSLVWRLDLTGPSFGGLKVGFLGSSSSPQNTGLAMTGALSHPLSMGVPDFSGLRSAQLVHAG